MCEVWGGTAAGCGPCREGDERQRSVFRLVCLAELGRGIDPAARELFDQEWRVRKRELELDGLDFGAVDIEALTELLAARLAGVVPDRTEVSMFMGTVVVAGWGIDVALAVADGGLPAEELIGSVGREALEVASEAISEVTAGPWPAEPSQFAGGFPPANANIIDGHLSLSYGDPADPILAFEAIALADVLTQRA